MTDFEQERPVSVEQPTSGPGPQGFELPQRAIEIGVQIGRVIDSISEIRPPEPGYIWFGVRTPRTEGGLPELVLQQDQYPGVGVIMSVVSASLFRSSDQAWRYTRHMETSHSAGSRSSESIVVSEEDLAIAVFSYESYMRVRRQPKQYSWKNEEDRPFIEDALETFSGRLESWHDTAVAKIHDYKKPYDPHRKPKPVPLQFRFNILPFERPF